MQKHFLQPCLEAYLHWLLVIRKANIEITVCNTVVIVATNSTDAPPF